MRWDKAYFSPRYGDRRSPFVHVRVTKSRFLTSLLVLTNALLFTNPLVVPTRSGFRKLQALKASSFPSPVFRHFVSTSASSV